MGSMVANSVVPSTPTASSTGWARARSGQGWCLSASRSRRMPCSGRTAGCRGRGRGFPPLLQVVRRDRRQHLRWRSCGCAAKKPAMPRCSMRSFPARARARGRSCAGACAASQATCQASARAMPAAGARLKAPSRPRARRDRAPAARSASGKAFSANARRSACQVGHGAAGGEGCPRRSPAGRDRWKAQHARQLQAHVDLQVDRDRRGFLADALFGL